MPADSDNLQQKAVRAAALGYAGTVARLVIQIGSQLVLARLLGPAEYGLFAIAVLSVSLSVFASDIASSALVHAKELNETAVRFAFTWQTLCGLALSGGLALVAQPLADWLKQPGVATLLLVCSPICFVNALGGVSLALLRRNLDYGAMQISQTAGYFTGYVLVGIPVAAWTNAGVWALVAAWAVQSFIATLGYIRRAPHAWRPLFHCPDSRLLVRFGLQAMLANFSNWVLANVDRLIVARTAPIREMGLYSTMINLLSTPLAQILGTYQSVAFAASARSGEESARRTFVLMLSGGSLIVCLLFGVVLAIPDTLIQVLYGPKWSDATPYITAFSLGFIAYGIQATITPLLWGRGAVEREAIPQFAMALLLGAAAWIASDFSTLAVAWAFAGVNVIRCAWIVLGGITTFHVSTSLCIYTIMRSTVAGAGMGASLWACDQLIRSEVTSPILWLFADISILMAVVWIATIKRHLWLHRPLAELLERKFGSSIA